MLIRTGCSGSVNTGTRNGSTRTCTLGRHMLPGLRRHLVWMWGAPPNLREALRKALVEPFEGSQSHYSLHIE